MLLILLDAAGSDLPSLPALFLPPSTDGGGSGKVCRVPKLFPIILKYLNYFESICDYHYRYLQHVLSTKAWG